MKTLISISFLFLALPAFSATTLFYTGEAISTKGTSVERHRYLLARTSDEQKNTIEEKVVSFQRDHYKENASVMKIDGNNFSMTEDTKTITGNGEFTGLPWQWTFLRAEFSMATPQFKMRIVDYNFLGDETTIAGHKDF